MYKNGSVHLSIKFFFKEGFITSTIVLLLTFSGMEPYYWEAIHDSKNKEWKWHRQDNIIDATMIWRQNEKKNKSSIITEGYMQIDQPNA